MVLLGKIIMMYYSIGNPLTMKSFRTRLSAIKPRPIAKISPSVKVYDVKNKLMVKINWGNILDRWNLFVNVCSWNIKVKCKIKNYARFLIAGINPKHHGKTNPSLLLEINTRKKNSKLSIKATQYVINNFYNILLWAMYAERVSMVLSSRFYWSGSSNIASRFFLQWWISRATT